MKRGDNLNMKKNRLLSKKLYRNFYLLGFTDAEGCFTVSMKKQKDTRYGWVLDPLFQVPQHKNSRDVLEMFRNEFRCGRIVVKPGQPELLVYQVDNRRLLKEVVIKFFEKYKPLVKEKDFQTFKEIVESLERKDHKDREKFIALIKKAYTMNFDGKQRRYNLETVLYEIKKTESSEAIRQTP